MRKGSVSLFLGLGLFSLAVGLGSTWAADMNAGMKAGTPDLKLAGSLAFGPDGILFIGDPVNTAIFAVDTGDRKGSGGTARLQVEAINEKVASLLGTTPDEILINDLAVNPASGKAYLSVSRGRGPGAVPVILRVDRSGKIEEFSLKEVKFSKAELPNPPGQERQRMESITDLAFIDGRVYVAGLSSEEFASRLRSLEFPFKGGHPGSSIEIYHGSHGQLETRSPVRTFAPYTIGNEAYLLAAYTCTPLVKIPVSQLKPGMHVKGVTVAELGNRNRPLDMVIYQKGGKDYILLANSSRGVMKITTDNIGKVEAITQRISDKAGLTYETLDQLKGVQQLDRLDTENALLLVRAETGTMSLQTIPLP